MTAVKIKELTFKKADGSLQITVPKVWLDDNKFKKGAKVQLMRANDKGLGDVLILARIPGGKN